MQPVRQVLPLRALRRQRGFAVVLLVTLLAYGGLLTGLRLHQESLLFHPTPLPPDYRFADHYAADQVFEELRIPVEGAELDALLFRQPASRGLVFYLHGNAGNLATWTTNTDFYRQLGYDLFMLDYRGFGRSSGQIGSEAELHADVRAAWERIAPAYAGKPIVIVGRSLGSGLATRLAADVHPDLLVLISPYASLRQLAAERFPLVPTILLKYPLESDARIGSVKSPVLILHGDQDEVIPLTHARRLAALAGQQARLRVVEGAHHSDIQGFAAYQESLARSIAELVPLSEQLARRPRQPAAGQPAEAAGDGQAL